MATKRKKKRLALGQRFRDHQTTQTETTVKCKTELDDRHPSSPSVVETCSDPPSFDYPVADTVLSFSPASLHNLTVTYHYAQSPINSSTRSLSELSCALPSDGAPLKSQCSVRTPPGSPPRHSSFSKTCHSNTPTSNTSSRPVRKKLKIESNSHHSADVQRLLNIASQLCHAPHDTTNQQQLNLPLNPSLPQSGKFSNIEFIMHEHNNSETQVQPQFNSECENSTHQDTVPLLSWDDEAFWSQAADVVAREEWDNDDEGDSAFIDGLLSTGLVWTPRSHHSTPRTSYSSLSTSQPSSSSSSCTTPLSHHNHIMSHSSHQQLF